MRYAQPALRAELRELLSRRSVLQRVLSTPFFLRQRGRAPWLDALFASLPPVRGLAAAASPVPAPAPQGASLPPAPGGLVIDVRAAPYGAIGDGVHDDGPALSRALAVFAAASVTNAGVALHLPPGRYRTSQMLRCVGALGGHIMGAGIDQTILQADAGTAGSPAILQLVNCQFVTCAAMTFWGTGDAPGAEAAWQSFGDIGQPAFAPNNNRCSSIAVERCPIGFSISCANLLTPVVMTSGAGVSPITVTTGIPHGLSTGSVVGIVGVRGNEAANTGGSVRVLTPNRFEINGTGDGAYAGGGTVLWTYMDGGEKANRSDANNDGMKFDHCFVRGASVAGVFIGGENSLVHEFHACDLIGQVGVWMPAGGSFSMYGGSISASSWDFVYAGRSEHPINIFGTCTEGGSGFLSVEPVPHPLSGGALVFNAFGYDKKGGPAAKTNAIVRTSGRGVAPITVTTDAPHELRTGQFASISGVQGNDAANGIFAVQVLTNTTFTVAALGKGDYAGGGQVKSARRLIDLNGPQCYVSLTGCTLAAWAAPGQLAIYCKDGGSRGPASRIRLADCEVGADE
ncbi:MAG TPA: glycosyl hydrolase family 28-related protein, partial [Polyangiaceae bacterium]|nr:glycosyl hydrolase family 28-related protein [Polyangiaceae bacterium]